MKKKLANYKSQLSPLIKSKTSKLLGLMISGNLIASLCGFFSSILIFRNLDQTLIGILYPLVGLLQIIGQLADLGINVSFVKSASTRTEGVKQLTIDIFYVKLALSLLFALLCFLGSTQIALIVLNDASHASWINLVAAFIPIKILAGFLKSHLQVRKKFNLINWGLVIPSILKLGSITLLIYFISLTLKSAFFALMVLPTFGFIIFCLDFPRVSPPSITSIKKSFLNVFQSSKWILLSIFSVAVIGQSDILMVSAISGAKETSILTAGLKLASIFSIVTGAIVTILLPKVTGMKTKKELNYFIRKLVLFFPVILSVIYIGILIASPLINTLLGDKYIESIPIFKIYIFSFGLDLLISPISLVLYNLNREKELFKLNFFQMIINIVGNYFLIMTIGGIGAAIVSASIKLMAIPYFYFILKRDEVI